MGLKARNRIPSTREARKARMAASGPEGPEHSAVETVWTVDDDQVIAAEEDEAEDLADAHSGSAPSEHDQGRLVATWESRPDKPGLQERIDHFFRAVAAGDFGSAFALCPQEPSATDPDMLVEHMQRELLEWEFVSPEEAEHWYRHITPPADVGYEGVNLTMPEDEGDVLANVIVDGSVSDLTAFFLLTRQGDAWGLRFRMLHVM
jgi:hypothetical protein